VAGTTVGRRRAARGAVALALALTPACGPAAGPAPSAAPTDVATAGEAPDAPPIAPPDAPPAEAPDEAPVEPPADGPGGDGTRAEVPGTCDPATEAAVAGTVAAQLDALGVGDFAAAYAQASPFFRTLVDQDAFTAMIRTRYPELLDVATRRLEGCTVLNRRAVLVVALTATDGARRTLAYELGESDDGWRIDGAYDLEPPEPAPAAPQV
jgi:hypothetical protein